MTNQLTYTNPNPTTAVRPPQPTVTPSPTTIPDRPRRGRKWMLVAGGAAVVATAAFTFVNLGGESSAPATPASVQRPSYLIIQDEIDLALARTEARANSRKSATEIIQDEIYAGLAARKAAAAAETRKSATEIIQDEIYAGLEARKAASTASTEG